jgi:hypothetical protein
VEIPLPLWDFQAQWKSPAFGLFHEAAFSTAPLPPNCAVDPFFFAVDDYLLYLQLKAQLCPHGRPITCKDLPDGFSASPTVSVTP